MVEGPPFAPQQNAHHFRPRRVVEQLRARAASVLTYKGQCSRLPSGREPDLPAVELDWLSLVGLRAQDRPWYHPPHPLGLSATHSSLGLRTSRKYALSGYKPVHHHHTSSISSPLLSPTTLSLSNLLSLQPSLSHPLSLQPSLVASPSARQPAASSTSQMSLSRSSSSASSSSRIHCARHASVESQHETCAQEH